MGRKWNLWKVARELALYDLSFLTAILGANHAAVLYGPYPERLIYVPFEWFFVVALVIYAFARTFAAIVVHMTKDE